MLQAGDEYAIPVLLRACQLQHYTTSLHSVKSNVKSPKLRQRQPRGMQTISNYRRTQHSGSRIWERGIWARLFGALQVWPPAHVQDSPNTQCKVGAVRMPLQCSQTAADALQATRLPLVRSSAEAVDLRSSRPHTRHAFQRRASIGTRVDGNSIGARKRSQPESISAT